MSKSATITMLKPNNQVQARSSGKASDKASDKSPNKVSKPLKFETPTLGDNTTPERLADELGAAREHKAYWEKMEAFYKEALKGRAKGTDAKSFMGDTFAVFISEESRTSLDSSLVRAKLSAEDLAECERTTNFEKVTVKRR